MYATLGMTSGNGATVSQLTPMGDAWNVKASVFLRDLLGDKLAELRLTATGNLDKLLRQRATLLATGENAGATGPLRGATIGVLGRFRDALGDEIREDGGKIPADHDARQFARIDTLNDDRALRGRAAEPGSLSRRQRPRILRRRSSVPPSTASRLDRRHLASWMLPERRSCYIFGMNAPPPSVETQQVVLALPRALVRTAERIAQRTHRQLETVLTEWIDRAASDLPVEALEDDDLLALCDVQMGEPEQTELSSLLAENREGRLDETGRALLDERMREYDQLLLRKAQALREAVARGRRGPMAA